MRFNIFKKKKRRNLLNLLFMVFIILAIMLYENNGNTYKTINDIFNYSSNLVNHLSNKIDDLINNITKNNMTDQDNLFVHYIDVGQGDSELIQVNGMNILIDTGEKDKSDDLISYLNKLDVKVIDILLITHPHTDHMGGAVDILNSFRVNKIYMTNQTHTTKAYEDLLDTIKEKGLKITRAKKGVTLDLGKKVDALILSPGKEYTDINTSSVVLKIDYGRTSFLFTGDATIETENDILDNYKDSISKGETIKTNVYKVAHHGSSYSNSKKFLKKINPELSIISASKDNSYGHPHKEVIKYLKDINSIILETKKLGTVIVSSDGIDIWYQSKGEDKVQVKYK